MSSGFRRRRSRRRREIEARAAADPIESGQWAAELAAMRERDAGGVSAHSLAAALDEMMPAPAPALQVPWADPQADILADLHKAAELALSEPYRLDVYVCPWCPSLAYGYPALAEHVRWDHPRHAALLGLEPHA